MYSLRDAITACDQWYMALGVDFSKIATSNILFGKLSLFDEYTDIAKLY